MVDSFLLHLLIVGFECSGLELVNLGGYMMNHLR